MRVLAIDCSTEWLAVALGDASGFHERREHAGQTHSERVLPLVDALLAEVGWKLADLGGIAFGAGPGSFTGVRIACGVAQGLALGRGLPVAAVSTLEAIAQDAHRAHGATRVFACTDARMKEVYVAAYDRADARWREVLAKAGRLEHHLDCVLYSQGADEYVVKPLEPQELVLRLEPVRPAEAQEGEPR